MDVYFSVLIRLFLSMKQVSALNRNVCYHFWIFLIFYFSVAVVSASVSEKCDPGTLLDAQNRDDVKPTFPLREDLRLKSSNILKAHEILRSGLQQFLELKEADLETYLKYITESDSINFKDEYGVEIRAYYKVFQFIWAQYNETLCQNYATKQYDSDKLDLCSVARFLSHQPSVNNRGSIMKRMGDALEYKCHPCTPYKRKEYGGTVVPNANDISLKEGIPSEQIIILCKDYSHNGQKVIVSSMIPSTTISTKAREMIYATVTPIRSPFDYTPCKYYSNGGVVCDEIPLEEVQEVFKRTSFPRLAFVELTLQPYILSETFIPKDVFGSKRILDISIEFPDETTVTNRSLSLQVDADAFRSTKSYTKNFTINIMDCTLLDLDFLSGFDKLTRLALFNIENIQHCLPTLPPLPQLTSLLLSHCTELNVLNIFPTLKNGLQYVQFMGDTSDAITVNDKTLDRIIDWLFLSSANTLTRMTVRRMKQVTRVPLKLKAFKSMRSLHFFSNNIYTIKSGTFSFSEPVSFCDISRNGIQEIEPGAFQGDFKDARVDVYNNKLTRFEESVFGPMLQQMASGEGFIDAASYSGNPIDCSEGSICHLAWLRRYKAGADFKLNCSNGTSFKDLQPAGFNHCS